MPVSGIDGERILNHISKKQSNAQLTASGMYLQAFMKCGDLDPLFLWQSNKSSEKLIKITAQKTAFSDVPKRSEETLF